MQLNPLTLSFTGKYSHLESSFRETFFLNSLHHVRHCKLFAILFFSIFGLLDAIVFPEHRMTLWIIRYVIVSPIFLFGYLFSYSGLYRFYWQPINAFYIIATGVATIAMVGITPEPGSFLYAIGTVFCIFFGYTFIHARFITASIAGLVVIAAMEIVMIWVVKAPATLHLIVSSHFMGINVLGMVICYSIETASRKNFYLTYMLNKEKEKVGEANVALEKRVRDRTAELVALNKNLQVEITEREKAEAKVRKSLESLTTIIDSIDADIYVSKIDNHKIIMANKWLKERVDSALINEPCHRIIMGKDRPCSHCPKTHDITDADILPEALSWEEENPLSGQWFFHYSRLIKWVDDSIVKLHVATNITELKKMQMRLGRAKKMEAIGALAGGVAHDLNNILSGLVGYPELLLMDIPKDSPLVKTIRTIKKSGEKAAAIVQDMLTLARRGVAITEIMNLNQITKDYMESPELKNLTSRHKDIQIKFDPDENLFNLRGSSVHLSKTIMNLVTNAAEAMPKGGSITISTENRYVDRPMGDFESISEGEYVVLTIKDNGIGISPNDIGSIFEPFYTKKKMGRSGTGLGMSVVWGTVKDHNGFIDVNTKEGHGTRFDLYFPSERGMTQSLEVNVPMESYKGNGETALVIDDVQEQRELAVFVLKRLGYTATSVSSGEAAIDCLKKQPIDILVLDMIMEPGIDGLETYKKAISINPMQRAVIMSGFSESNRVLEAQRLGAGRYIKKPFTIESLGQALYKELNKSNDEKYMSSN